MSLPRFKSSIVQAIMIGTPDGCFRDENQLSSALKQIENDIDYLVGNLTGSCLADPVCSNINADLVMLRAEIADTAYALGINPNAALDGTYGLLSSVNCTSLNGKYVGVTCKRFELSMLLL